MALLTINFYSKVLMREVAVTAILPEKQHGVGIGNSPADEKRVNAAVWDGDTPLKTLYLLHGWSDNQTIWSRRTSVERYVAGKQLAVIMPSVENSFYTNECNGYDYWTFISEELPESMGSFFKLSSKREDTYAAGLSMGGYGALKLGLRKPERFSKVASLSGVLDLSAMFRRKSPDEYSFLRRVFGDDKHPQARPEDDILFLAQQTAEREDKPEIYLACGTADELYSDYLSGISLFSSLGYHVNYRAGEGEDHRWSYWDQAIQDVLNWLPV